MRPIEVESLRKTLLGRGETVAVSESVTGGMVSEFITDAPGASQIFRGSVVAYQIDVKQGLLKIDSEVLGVDAVNPSTAFELAWSAKQLFGSDWGLGITGFAGPDGGSAQAPLGTIFAAVAGPICRTAGFRSEGDRRTVRQEGVWFLLGLFSSCLDSTTELGL